MTAGVSKENYNQVGKLNRRFFSKPRNIFSVGIYVVALFFFQSIIPFNSFKETETFQFNSNLHLEKQIILASSAPLNIYSFLLESMAMDEDEEEKFFCSIQFLSFFEIIIYQHYRSDLRFISLLLHFTSPRSPPHSLYPI